MKSKTKEREIVYPISDESETHDIIVALRMVVEYLETFNMDKLQRETMRIAANRLEKSEKERDLAIKALADYEDAIDPTVEQIMREFHGTTHRGLPQDGEGKI